MIRNIFLVSLTLLMSLNSYSDQLQESRTITRIFSEGASTAGFYTAEGLSQCKWGIMYIDLRDSSGDEKLSGTSQLSMLLMAKAANYKIVRMDYVVSGDGSCRLSGLHIN